MRAALLIAAKDLRQRLRDRSALLVAIVVPLVLASIFGLIFHDVTSGRVTFTFAVVDQDRGDAARAFSGAGARSRSSAQGLIKRAHRAGASPPRATPPISGKVAAAIVVPAGLHGGGRTPGGRLTMRVIGDVDSPIGTQVAESIAQSFAGRIETAARRARRRRLAKRAAAPARSAPAPIALADVSTAQPAARRRHVLRRRDGRVLPVLHRPVRHLEHPRRAPRRHARADARRADPPRRRARRQAADEPRARRRRAWPCSRSTTALPARRALGQPARRRAADRRRRARRHRGDGARRHARADARPGAGLAVDGRRSCSACSAARSSRSRRPAVCSPRSAWSRRRRGSCAGSRT